MAPRKKTEIIEQDLKEIMTEIVPIEVPGPNPVVPMLPPYLSVDYPNEQLNNMARTINETLTYLRYGKE